jgi:hypothetical protein
VSPSDAVGTPADDFHLDASEVIGALFSLREQHPQYITTCDKLADVMQRLRARYDRDVAAVEARTLARVREMRLPLVPEIHVGICLNDSSCYACQEQSAAREINRAMRLARDTILRSLSASEDTTQGET